MCPCVRLRIDGRPLLRRVEKLSGPTRLAHAAFVPPGYSSLLFNALYSDGECNVRSQLLADFRVHVLRGLGLDLPLAPGLNMSQPLKVNSAVGSMDPNPDVQMLNAGCAQASHPKEYAGIGGPWSSWKGALEWLAGGPGCGWMGMPLSIWNPDCA